MALPLLYSACWPNLVYMYYVVNHPQVTIECFDTYARQTYRNRYGILGANGVQVLSVPVAKQPGKPKMNAVRISYTENWQIRHWRAITSAYGKSAFFMFFEDDIRPFYFSKTDLLLDYNLRQLDLIRKLLRLDVDVKTTTTYEKKTSAASDLRELADPSNNNSANPILAKPYFQVFGDRFGFTGNLSVLDLIFNAGLRAAEHLREKS